jgi:hypothetical protein
MFGQFPPKAKHSCRLLGAVKSTFLLVMLTFITPVALDVSKLIRDVTELPFSVAAVTLPVQPRPEIAAATAAAAAAAAAPALDLSNIVTSPTLTIRSLFH